MLGNDRGLTSVGHALPHRYADVVEIWVVQVISGWNRHSTIQHFAYGRRSVLGPPLVVEIIQNGEEMRHPKSHRVKSALNGRSNQGFTAQHSFLNRRTYPSMLPNCRKFRNIKTRRYGEENKSFVL